MAAAGRLRNKRLHNHNANKERLMREQSEKELQQLEVWFAEYDKDHNNKFDREELRQLFKVIEPKYELTDAAEKFMIEKIKDIEVATRETIMDIVKKYRHYIKNWENLNNLQDFIVFWL